MQSQRDVLALLVREAYRSLRYYSPSAASGVIAALGALEEPPRDTYALTLSVLPTLPAFSNGRHIARLFAGLSQLRTRHPMLTAHLLKKFLRCSFVDKYKAESAPSNDNTRKRLEFITSLAIVLRALHHHHPSHCIGALFDALDETLLSGRVLYEPKWMDEEDGPLEMDNALFFVCFSLQRSSGGLRRRGVNDFFGPLAMSSIQTRECSIDMKEEKERRRCVALALQVPRRPDRIDALLDLLRAVCPLPLPPSCREEIYGTNANVDCSRITSATLIPPPSICTAVNALLLRCSVCISGFGDASETFVLPSVAPLRVAELCVLRSRGMRSSLRKAAADDYNYILYSEGDVYDCDNRGPVDASVAQALVELAEWVDTFRRTMCPRADESVPTAATLQCVHNKALSAATRIVSCAGPRDFPATLRHVLVRAHCVAGPLPLLEQCPHCLRLLPLLLAEMHGAAGDPALWRLVLRCADAFACDPPDPPLLALHAAVWDALSRIAAQSPALEHWLGGFRQSRTVALVEAMRVTWPELGNVSCGGALVVANTRNTLLWSLLLLACFMRFGAGAVGGQRAVARIVQMVAQSTPLLGRRRPAPESIVALGLREGIGEGNAETEEVAGILEEVLRREKEQVRQWKDMYPVLAEGVARCKLHISNLTELGWGKAPSQIFFNSTANRFYCHCCHPFPTQAPNTLAKASGMDDASVSNVERELFFQVIFPYAPKTVISDAAALTQSVEDSIHTIHAAVNPDVYSAAFLWSEREKQKRSQDSRSSGSGSLTFNTLHRILTERSTLLEEQILASTSFNYEYVDTVAGFPIDTSAWDDYYLNSATVADVVGASSFSLSGNDTATQALVPKWSPVPLFLSPMHAKEQGWVYSRLFECILPLFTESVQEAMQEVHNINEVIVKTIGGLTKPFDFGLRNDRHWRSMIEELKPWEGVFNGERGCALATEITENCPKLAAVLPDVMPKFLEALEKELIRLEIAPAVREQFVNLLGGYTINCDPIKVHELVFGRSYIRFVDDGNAIVVRVKVKRIAFAPVSFSYRKARSSSGATTADLKVDVKDVIVKVKGDCILLTSGQTAIHCMKSRVSIGAINTAFSVAKLNFVAFLLKPTIRLKLRKELEHFLSGYIFLGSK